MYICQGLNVYVRPMLVMSPGFTQYSPVRCNAHSKPDSVRARPPPVTRCWALLDKLREALLGGGRQANWWTGYIAAEVAAAYAG